MTFILSTIHLEPSTRAIPLAAACLKSAAKSKHSVIILDFYLNQSVVEICDAIESCLGRTEGIKAIGFSIYLWNRPLSINCIKELKRRQPSLLSIVGGPEVTADPKHFLKDSACDIAMAGEGEPIIIPILDAIEKGKDFPSLPGLWTDKLEPFTSALCSNLQELQSPILDGSLDLKKSRGLLWELSRGCPFACSFCFESKGSKKVRTIGLDRIEDELKMMGEAGIEQVFVLDPTFNVSSERVLKIIDLIKKYTPHTYYYFEARTEFIDEKTAEAFASIPCTLQIGLQSANKEILKGINRAFDASQFKEKCQILSNYGVSFGLDLIYGLPHDSLKGFKKSLKYALSLEPNHLDIFPLSVLPGTALRESADEAGLIYQSEDPYRVLGNKKFPKEDLEKAEKLAHNTEELYNLGKGISWIGRVLFDLNISVIRLLGEWSTLSKGKDHSEEDLPELLDQFFRSLYKQEGKTLEAEVINTLRAYLDIESLLFSKGFSATSFTEGFHLESSNKIILNSNYLKKKLFLSPNTLVQNIELESEYIVNLAQMDDVIEEREYFFWLRDWELCSDQISDDIWPLFEYLKQERTVAEIESQFLIDGLKEFLLEGIFEGYFILQGQDAL